MSVAITHYHVGTPDSRLKKVDKTTPGVIKLYKMIQKENNGAESKVIFPMFLSSTDDTTVFAFEGSVDEKGSECCIVN